MNLDQTNSNPNPKPKYGEYQCLYCSEGHIEGAFLPDEKVFCYLCGKQMTVKNMIKIEKPKEHKSIIKPDPYHADPLSYTFTHEPVLTWSGYRWIIKDGHGKVRKDLMNGQDYI